MDKRKSTVAGGEPAMEDRRAALKTFGRYAAVTAPSVVLLLAASAKPASAGPGSITG